MSTSRVIDNKNEHAAPTVGLGLTALCAVAAAWALSRLVSGSNASDVLAFSSLACAAGLVRLGAWSRTHADWSDTPVALASIPFLGPAACVPAALATLARVASRDEEHSTQRSVADLAWNCGTAAAGGLLYVWLCGAATSSPISLTGLLAASVVFVASRSVRQVRESGLQGSLRMSLASGGVIMLAGIVLVFWCQSCPRYTMILTGALVAAVYAARKLYYERTTPVALQETQTVQVEAKPVEAARPSMIDPLTGVANDRYLYMFLQQEIGRSSRKNLPLSLVLLDIDDLESVNQAHGRERADEAMIELSKLVKELIREYDLVARASSDEFAIVLPEASCSDALDTAERIRSWIADFEFHNGLRLKASLGVASYPEHGATPDNLISSAHHALNRAKFSGKDRAVSCTEIVSQLRYGT